MKANKNENSQFLSTDNELELLSQIHDLYVKCKKMFMRAEECLPKMELFVAPLLEHRDAFDHIMRYYEKKHAGNCSLEKLLDELKEARCHEVRAFYDIADYTCILIRAYIAQRLKGVSRWRIRKVWPEYSTDRAEVMKQSMNLAELRSKRTGTFEGIAEYEAVVENFYTIYKKFIEKIDPKL